MRRNTVQAKGGFRSVLNSSRFSREWFALIFSLVIITIAAAVFYTWNESTANVQQQKTDSTWSLIVRPIQPTDHVIGSPSAPVTLVVYSDLSCIYCKNLFDKTLPRLESDFLGKIVVVYRHMPLASHPQAFNEAINAECVYRAQGDPGFFRYKDEIYKIPTFEEGLTPAALESLAVSIGVPQDSFESCLTDPSVTTRVKTDSLEAAVAGLSISPSIVVKSDTRAVTVQGNYYSQLTAAIRYVLSPTY